jgi:hypothetical protein
MNTEIEKFLKSQRDELDYFGLESCDCISLNEYLFYLKNKEQEYRLLTEELLKRINTKCNWVKALGFKGIQSRKTGEYTLSFLFLFPVDGRTEIIQLNRDGSLKPMDNEYPLIYLIKKTNRKSMTRQKELILIEEELKEAIKIGQKVFNGCFSKSSISKLFNIYFSPYQDVAVMNNGDVLALFPVTPNAKKEDEEELNIEEKSELLKRVRVKI